MNSENTGRTAVTLTCNVSADMSKEDVYCLYS